MKKLLLCFIAIQTIYQPLKAQITLENTYPNAGFYDTLVVATYNYWGKTKFYLVDLEVSGPKYVKIDPQLRLLTFYNLDHSLFKSISYAAVTLVGPKIPALEKHASSVLYISQKLFDSDNEIEFMYSSYDANFYPTFMVPAITQIVNEDGSILFTANGEVPLVAPTVHNQYYPIYNTPAGTKMILCKNDGSARVYGLTGVFSNSIKGNNIEDLMDFSLFPNPVMKSQHVKIEYTLPDDTDVADLKIYDGSGRAVKTYRVANTSQEILIPTEDLGAGIYFYEIRSGSAILGTKKSIIIE